MSSRQALKLQVAPFVVDVTPPVGHPIAYGINKKTDSPICVRGAVISDGETRTVLASADFIGFHGAAYGRIRDRIRDRH